MSKDYNYRTVIGTDPDTGYPTDKYGHLLDPFDKRGDTAKELTNPYGALEWAVGDGDDFYCFDYALLTSVEHDTGMAPCCDKYIAWAGQGPTHVALHSVINSETGGFIQDDRYLVVPLREASCVAASMVEDAMGGDAGIRHSRVGWNQDPFYFFRCVAASTNPPPFKVTERMKRFGGKRINAFCGIK